MVKNFTQEPEPVHNWHKPQLDRNKHHWGWLSSSPIVRMQWNVTWPVWWCFLIEQVCCLNGVHKLDVSMCVCVCVCMYVCIHISDLPNDSQIYFPLKINIKHVNPVVFKWKSVSVTYSPENIEKLLYLKTIHILTFSLLWDLKKLWFWQHSANQFTKILKWIQNSDNIDLQWMVILAKLIPLVVINPIIQKYIYCAFLFFKKKFLLLLSTQD